MKQEVGKIWKIRTVKNYSEAQNHLMIGRIVELHDTYVKLHCKTYHFGRNVNSPRDISVGSEGVRILPWSRIEIVNELPLSFDYVAATIHSEQPGRVALKDGACEVPILEKHDRRV